MVGGGIAGLAAATGLAERGVAVTLVEAAPTLGGRVRAWPIAVDGGPTTMSRGFHAFFRQYYNLRALMRRADEIYPGWDFAGNVGYSTPEHREAILANGISPLHRRSFASVAYSQLELDEGAYSKQHAA